MRIRRIYGVSVLTVILLAFTRADDSTRPAQFHWPESNHYNRVIVNAQQGVGSYSKDWFSQDFLVTDLTIADANKLDGATAKQQYQALRDLLTSYGLAVGTYISGTTAEPLENETKYPPAVVPLESMTKTSVYVGTLPDETYRRIIDLSDPDTRHSFQAAIKTLWEANPAPVRFVDNAAVHASAGKGQSWASYCQNMKEIRELGETMGSVQIFNIAVHVSELSDAEAAELMQAVGRGGILLEMPWHLEIRKNPAATERARSRYRQLLDSGMAIIMAEPGPEPSEALVKWVSTWRKPTDHLYFAGAFWKQPNPTLFSAVQ